MAKFRQIWSHWLQDVVNVSTCISQASSLTEALSKYHEIFLSFLWKGFPLFCILHRQKVSRPCTSKQASIKPLLNLLYLPCSIFNQTQIVACGIRAENLHNRQRRRVKQFFEPGSHDIVPYVILDRNICCPSVVGHFWGSKSIFSQNLGIEKRFFP